MKVWTHNSSSASWDDFIPKRMSPCYNSADSDIGVFTVRPFTGGTQEKKIKRTAQRAKVLFKNLQRTVA